MNNYSRITDWLLLLAVPAFFFLWKLSAFGLIGADEPRYAQVAREMLMRHDWVTPTLGGTPWLEKPPLYYWQAMVAYKLFGVSDWAARLPSVFDAFLLVLAIYFFLRRFRPRAELDAVLIAATAAGIVGFVRAASTDMPLTATFSIAMLAWHAWIESNRKRYLAGFYLFLAFAMLAKGPVAAILAIAIIAILAAAQKSAQSFWKTLWTPGILLLCATALPWYVLVQLKNPQFFREFIIGHNLARFGTNLYHHPEPFWYYLPVTVLGWIPWSVLAVIAIIWTLKTWRKPDADPLRSLLVIWIVVVVALFSISQSKLPGYILPAIPAGAILAAEFIRESPHRQTSSWVRFLVAGLHAATLGGIIFCALTIQSLILLHHVLWNTAIVPLAVSILAAIGIFILLITSNFRMLRGSTLVPLIVALAVAVRLGAQPLDERLSARPIANMLASFDPHHLPVAVFLTSRETEFGLAFYRNQVIARYELKQILEGEHLVVAAQGFQKGVAKESGRKPLLLGSFPPQKLEFFYVPKL